MIQSKRNKKHKNIPRQANNTIIWEFFSKAKKKQTCFLRFVCFRFTEMTIDRSIMMRIHLFNNEKWQPW